MNLLPFVSATLLPMFSLLAQEPKPVPAAPTAPALPAAGSPEASALLDKAINKMQAYGRGKFRTSEAHDNALMRHVQLPAGNEDTEVDGGWSMDLVWGDADGDQFARNNGRMIAKLESGWHLRRDKLASGKAAPFALDPNLLFLALRELPADARKIVNVEAGDIGGRAVAILSMQLTGDSATDFVEGGSIPSAAGGPGGGIFMLGGMGGNQPPPPEHTAYLAMSVDLENGDLLRFAARVLEKNTMMGNVRIQVQGNGNGNDDDDDKEDAKDAADAPLVWKQGLPKKKPAKDESVLNYRVDFKQLGRAEAPELDAKAKSLLRLR